MRHPADVAHEGLASGEGDGEDAGPGAAPLAPPTRAPANSTTRAYPRSRMRLPYSPWISPPDAKRPASGRRLALHALADDVSQCPAAKAPLRHEGRSEEYQMSGRRWWANATPRTAEGRPTRDPAPPCRTRSARKRRGPSWT